MPKGKQQAKSAKAQVKKTNKIIEDKTFGLKNKNKSKKVQRYVEQVSAQARNGGGKQGRAFHEQNAARRKAEKEARKQAELEMFKLLGDAYQPKKKNRTKKSIKKDEEQKRKEQEEKEQKQKEQNEKDFAVPIKELSEILLIENRTEVERIVVVLEFKDNLLTKPTRNVPGFGQEYLTVKVSDGTTRLNLPLLLFNYTPSTFEKKVGNVLDVRNLIAIKRAKKVVLEISKETEILDVSENLKEIILKKKEEAEEIRAKGGIPIEQLIEEQRLNLKTEDLIPVTKEGFFKWKEEKRQKFLEETQKKVKEEKKVKTKNIDTLTGKQLFLVDKSLFQDAEDAFDINKETAELELEDENLFLEEGDDDLDDLED
eukprot:augustus_masked-scaffold_8-processed-gene-6.65-mRNA-1 protein AED:0.06 eAED:0.08 QI:0/-1/0/1/-1/1/1/0/369